MGGNEMKQQFRTHEEIDNYYRVQGVDVDKLKIEEIAVGIILDKSERDAKLFLKQKMNFLSYFLWVISSFELIPSLGMESRYKSKAKKLGWTDTFQYPKGF